MRIRLTHEGSAFINFRDYKFQDRGGHGFRWVDIKILRLPATPVEDGELLSAVIRHEQFRDDYAGGGVLPEGVRHGPYWLASVTPDAYQTVSREQGTHILRGWVDLHGDVPAELEEDLRDGVFDRVAAADRLFYLNGLGDDAVHDWGRVHEFFHEFVLVDRRAERVALLVAADD
ncbi:hypothetical protein JK359_34255 [Streptomyces actinomycinicus]|uniref:Uncharacterized protein n=1 Tax=Streptomyces actinomycinicus TaxID=1695166 RepID=A0A937ERP3_9ACTN|nr:hypothetical protein [Streptomyces actinomycinicus]MBL1086971.1 hypothetical protein [Streptomyces actinomycinicus]